MNWDDDPRLMHLRQQILDGGGEPWLPVGSRTKSGLTTAPGCRSLEVGDFQGIVAYDPAEFLLTARAGTRVAEAMDALTRHGQYLPFDPLFVADGATLGGTIASGISGPDRLLYGGLRDFVMEVALIDGLGALARGGGKVVKNAAGFDIPKMMVGSYGRLGVLVEVTLKVLPRPQASASLTWENDSIEQAVPLMQRLLARPFPIAGLDIDAHHRVCLRLAGPASSLAAAAQRLIDVAGRSAGTHLEEHPRPFDLWLQRPLSEAECLVRVAVSPPELAQLSGRLSALKLTSYWHCGGGSVTWIRLTGTQIIELDQALSQLGLAAVVVRGAAEGCFLGNRCWIAMAQRIQQAVDPSGRFARWDAGCPASAACPAPTG